MLKDSIGGVKKREKKIDKRKSRYKKEDLFMEPIGKHKNTSNGDK
jgi:hypothetical protein